MADKNGRPVEGVLILVSHFRYPIGAGIIYRIFFFSVTLLIKDLVTG
jgi:hypothetical protein